MIEHGAEAAKIKTGAEAALRVQDDEFGEREAELKASCRRLQAQLREAQRAGDELADGLKKTHEAQLTKLRGEFEERCRELEARYERRVKQVREEMELRRQAEVREVEERKNAHIAELMKRHERAFQDMKAYYNDIFMSNADLIKSLKEQITEAKERDTERDKEVADVRGENKRLADPLHRAQAQVQELSLRVAELQKEKVSLKTTKSRLKTVEGELKSLRWENEVLVQRFEQAQRERDELYARFLAAIRDVQQKSGYKTLLLEQRIAAFREALDVRDT
jgi:chromosome segregation ATPase